ncbi:hypothetical protein TNCV_3059291 [Trichonephila clavipes]|nr:hypothetical protein TNCV_3059291 [Trichonephila clavipes]
MAIVPQVLDPIFTLTVTKLRHSMDADVFREIERPFLRKEKDKPSSLSRSPKMSRSDPVKDIGNWNLSF